MKPAAIHRGWWERPPLLAAIVLISAVPLMWPAVPPLVDLPGHVARYHVQLSLHSSPLLQRYFSFSWTLMGNLGVDLILIPIAKVVNLDLAVKFIVTAIPPLTTAGILWTAREAHGHIPPTTLFAVPLSYGLPFNYGFINFALSIALALLALALWIRLGRQRRWQLRSTVFLPMSCVLWVTHVYGWALLSLTAWSSEVIRKREDGGNWPSAIAGATVQSAVLAPPMILMMAWRANSPAGVTYGFFDLSEKTSSLLAAVEDRWLLWDSFSVAAILVLISASVFDKQFRVSRALATSALACAAAYLLLPFELFGSAFADARIVPFLLMIAVLAIRLRDARPTVARNSLALLGLSFIVLRLIGNTVSFAIADRELSEEVSALHFIPSGSRVLSLVGDSCGNDWPLPRNEHIGAFVISRRDGFSNDQWLIPGSQQLVVHYPAAQSFQVNPSQLAFTPACVAKLTRGAGSRGTMARTLDSSLAQFPRGAFDFVWIVDAHDPEPPSRQSLKLVWQRGRSYLYRVYLPTARAVSAPPRPQLGITGSKSWKRP